MRDDLPELNKAGVASIKLEGRLKRPEYVATIANSYRNAIDAMDNGHFRKADEAEMTGLRQIFSRGGFMRGYAMGAEDAGVIDPARVSHGGVKIGRVEFAAGNMARVRLERNLDDGDGLQIRTAQGDAELIYAGHDTEAGQIAVVRLRPDIRTKARWRGLPPDQRKAAPMGAKPCHSRDSGGYGADCISRKAACAHHDRRRKQCHRHGRHGCPRAEPRHERRGRAAQSGQTQRHAVFSADADGADRGRVRACVGAESAAARGLPAAGGSKDCGIHAQSGARRTRG